MPRYPPEVGVAAFPSPTNTESRFPLVTATDGVESTGTPPVLTGHPGTPAPDARLNAYTFPALSPTTTEGPPARVATLGDDNAIGPPPSLRVCVHVSVTDTAWASTAACAPDEPTPSSAPATTATPK